MASVYILNDKMYIGDTEIDDSYLKTMFSDIREYLNYELIGLDYSLIDPNPSPIPLPPTPPFAERYDWRTAIVTVPTDDVTMVVLPFRLINTDPDSIMITVNDNNPVHMVTADQEGCHIVDNVLYWHEYYNLKQGDRILFQYLDIS